MMPKSIVIATLLRPAGATGVQTHFFTFASWLRDKGHKFCVITPFSTASWKIYPVFGLGKLIEKFNSSAYVWWYRYWHYFFLKSLLDRKLKDGDSCTVYAQCPVSAKAALEARRSLNQKIVLVVHFNTSQADEWAQKGGIKYGGSIFRAIRRLEQAVIPAVDGIVFVSRFAQQALQVDIPRLVSVRQAVIPNFVTQPASFRRSDEILHSGDLVCVGSLEPRKNQRYALEVVHAAKRAGMVLKLAFMGDGPDRHTLMERVKELDIQEQVQFLGSVTSAGEHIHSYRACLHVAKMENLSIVLVEALAQGLPLFSSAVGGIPEVFEDGVQGRYLPLNDAAAAARLIVEWLGCPETLHRASCAARKHYVEKFETNVVAANLLQFLEEAHVGNL